MDSAMALTPETPPAPVSSTAHAPTAAIASHQVARLPQATESPGFPPGDARRSCADALVSVVLQLLHSLMG